MILISPLLLFPLIQMINALVIARHSDPAANEVIRVLEDHTAGNFSHNKVPLFILRFFFIFHRKIVTNSIWLLYPLQVQNYITERRRQIGAINKFFTKTLGQNTPQIGDYSKADIVRAMLKSQFIFVLYVAVLPDLNEDKYLNFNMDDRTNYWYNNEIVVGEIR